MGQNSGTKGMGGRLRVINELGLSPNRAINFLQVVLEPGEKGGVPLKVTKIHSKYLGSKRAKNMWRSLKIKNNWIPLAGV